MLKSELTEKLESDVSVSAICMEYGVQKQMLCLVWGKQSHVFSSDHQLFMEKALAVTQKVTQGNMWKWQNK
jgi:hypothetical protein